MQNIHFRLNIYSALQVHLNPYAFRIPEHWTLTDTCWPSREKHGVVERCVQFSRASSRRRGVSRGLVFMFSLPLLAGSKSVCL